jgi:hypothetical protein
MLLYQVRYTNYARKHLGERLTVFEEQFCEELAELLEESEPDDLLFHTVEFDGRLYAGTWHEGRWLMIDSATEVETTITAGPNKGQKIVVPKPDSE